MVPSYLFNDFESKPIVLIEVLFCNEDEKVFKQLLKNLKAFTKKQKHTKKTQTFELFGKQKMSDRFFLWKRETYTLYVKSIRESVFVRKIIYLKPKEILLLVGMRMKIHQTKIQNQTSIPFNTLIMFFNGKCSVKTGVL